MLKMNPGVREEWCKALRSGDYIQTKGVLRNEAGYCCLGVLEDLYLRQQGVELGLCEEAHLDQPVVEWAGLCVQSPSVDRCYLTTLNDVHKLSFPQIADIIDGTASWDQTRKTLIYPTV